MKNTILPSFLSYTASTVFSFASLDHICSINAGYPCNSPSWPNLHTYLPLKKYVSFRMTDTASKDVSQKYGLLSSTCGLRGGLVLLVVEVVVVDAGVVVVVELVVVLVVVLNLVVGVVYRGVVTRVFGVYGVLTPHILPFFEPIIIQYYTITILLLYYA